MLTSKSPITSAQAQPSRVLTTLASAVCNATTGASFPADWKYYQTIEIAETGLVKVSVPLETLDAARPDLADLRIFKVEGREVPFRIGRSAAEPTKLRAAVNLAVTMSTNATVLTFDTGTKRNVDQISIETPAHEFIKSVTVEGSKDGAHWQLITSQQPVFRRPGAAKLHVQFSPVSWPNFRVTIDGARQCAHTCHGRNDS